MNNSEKFKTYLARPLLYTGKHTVCYKTTMIMEKTFMSNLTFTFIQEQETKNTIQVTSQGL